MFRLSRGATGGATCRPFVNFRRETLIRGPITPNAITGTSYRYPHPFLDPNLSASGHLSVAFYVVLIAAVVGLAAAGVVWVSKRKPLLRGA